MKAVFTLLIAITLSGCAGRPMTPEEWARAQAMMQASGEAVQHNTEQVQRAWDANAAAHRSTTTNCTSSVVGSQVYTTCN